MYWPLPPRSRSRSAARIALVAYIPVNRSETATPTFCGPPPGSSSRSPVTVIAAAKEGRPPLARVVAVPGALHLDHLGAQVGEILGGPGSREHAGQVQHTDTVEDLAHRM